MDSKTTTEAQELKVCPFCGSEGHYKYRDVVICSDIECPLAYVDFDTEGWNTRPSDSGDEKGLLKKIWEGAPAGDPDATPEQQAYVEGLAHASEIIIAFMSHPSDSWIEGLVKEIRRVCIYEWFTGTTGKDATDKVIEIAIEIIEAHPSKAVPDSGDEKLEERIIKAIQWAGPDVNLPDVIKSIFRSRRTKDVEQDGK